MSLSGIISVSGLPGLHKILSQTKNGLIVESLIDERRRPIYSTQKVSALEDISIYTLDDDMPLADVFEKMYDKEKGKQSLSHKTKPDELRTYLSDLIDNIDHERVYNSDVAKLFQWYNLLIDKNLLEKEEEVKEESKKEKAPAKEKKAAVKKTTEKKTSAPKATAKKTPTTRSTAKKGGNK